jgi:hypothetical protein
MLVVILKKRRGLFSDRRKEEINLTAKGAPPFHCVETCIVMTD